MTGKRWPLVLAIVLFVEGAIIVTHPQEAKAMGRAVYLRCWDLANQITGADLPRPEATLSE